MILAAADALGVDYKEEEIENCRNRFSELKFEVQNAENLKFKDNSVNAFFMINVIHYTNREKAIQGAFRILKSLGYLSILILKLLIKMELKIIIMMKKIY